MAIFLPIFEKTFEFYTSALNIPSSGRSRAVDKKDDVGFLSLRTARKIGVFIIIPLTGGNINICPFCRICRKTRTKNNLIDRIVATFFTNSHQSPKRQASPGHSLTRRALKLLAGTVLTVALALATAGNAFAQIEIRWGYEPYGDWFVANNWEQLQIPGAEDTASVRTGTAYINDREIAEADYVKTGMRVVAAISAQCTSKPVRS